MINNDTHYNDIFYAWEQTAYKGDSTLSDDDRILWIKAYRKGLEDAIKHILINKGKTNHV